MIQMKFDNLMIKLGILKKSIKVKEVICNKYNHNWIWQWIAWLKFKIQIMKLQIYFNNAKMKKILKKKNQKVKLNL